MPNVLEEHIESSDVQSFIERVLESNSSSGNEDNSLDSCTVPESLNLRAMLRSAKAPSQFIDDTINSERYTAKKLCTAFDIRPSLADFDRKDEKDYYALLAALVGRELGKRVKLTEYNSVEDAVFLLQNSNNIIVLTGAGISTSLGVPDFRSKETGLYSQLQQRDGLDNPEEIFNLERFLEDPKFFYSFANKLLPPSNGVCSPTHSFIKLLQDKGKLLTNFTQNIDNFEKNAGIDSEKLIQWHGSFATASCTRCKEKVDGDNISQALKDGKVAQCKRCPSSEGLKPRPGRKGSKDAVTGVMKPDITFFGEDIDPKFQKRLERDRDEVDLVLIIGTSLKVTPFSNIIHELPSQVPQIYISRDHCSHNQFDIEFLGECDAVLAELCHRAGWGLKDEMKKMENVQVKVELCQHYQSRYRFKAEHNAEHE